MPLRDELSQQFADLAGRDRVDAFEGFVEEQHARLVDERAGERELLAHAVRVTADRLRSRRREIHRGKQFASTFTGDRSIEAHDLTDEAQVLLAGQALEQVQAVRHDADAALDLEVLRRDIEAQHLCAAARWREQASEDIDGGRFAGAVGPEESVERAFRHAKREPVDRDLRAERTRELMGLNGITGHSVISSKGTGRAQVIRHAA